MSDLEIALLVVDAQESFRHRTYWRDEDVPRFVNRLQALIDGAKAQGIPVVQIVPVFAPSSAAKQPLVMRPTWDTPSTTSPKRLLRFPMTARHERIWSPVDLKARTELVLEDRFACIRTVDEIFPSFANSSV